MSIIDRLLRKTELEKRVTALERQVERLSRKTISQTTTEEDTPPTPTQILDEWLNGKEEDDA